MEINREAPLNSRKEIVISATLDTVWSVLTDVKRWPEWQPDVAFARLDHNLGVGAVFRWKAKGFNITSTIQEFEPGRRIGWTGDSTGMKAIHIWSFEANDTGTRVITEESLSGWLPRVLRIFDSKFLEKSLARSLQVLKAQAEVKQGQQR
jgi:uncharacterized protein YndB with AHSA1/START domain